MLKNRKLVLDMLITADIWLVRFIKEDMNDAWVSKKVFLVVSFLENWRLVLHKNSYMTCGLVAREESSISICVLDDQTLQYCTSNSQLHHSFWKHEAQSKHGSRMSCDIKMLGPNAWITAKSLLIYELADLFFSAIRFSYAELVWCRRKGIDHGGYNKVLGYECFVLSVAFVAVETFC